VTDVSDPATESGVNTRSRLLHNWRHVMRTSNPPAGRVDPISRWLVISRASVLPMTLTAAAIAGLLAAFHDENVRWGLFALAAVGLVFAHDLFDLEVGADSDSYPRALYAPHPVLSGTISRRGLLTAAIAFNAADLAVLVALVVFRGWPMIVFALSGFLLSVAYTAPPVRLKKHGLGEPTVLVVWGPLMVGGAYYAATGHFPFGIFVASLAYALLCTAVLMGKHIDKIPWDAPYGTHTLPVLLGESRARALTQGMMVAFYVLVVLLVGTGTLPIAALIVLLALPKLAKVWRPFSQPKPAEPPENFPIWPLWFAALAFVHTRRAGGLLVLGLIVGVILGW
jgi:1,4-dihydroxy-2-naphthoate octaprenyltransferase